MGRFARIRKIRISSGKTPGTSSDGSTNVRMLFPFPPLPPPPSPTLRAGMKLAVVAAVEVRSTCDSEPAPLPVR